MCLSKLNTNRAIAMCSHGVSTCLNFPIWEMQLFTFWSLIKCLKKNHISVHLFLHEKNKKHCYALIWLSCNFVSFNISRSVNMQIFSRLLHQLLACSLLPAPCTLPVHSGGPNFKTECFVKHRRKSPVFNL